MKNIIFLNRAYNDLDIQCSLIDAFAGDSGWHVRVVGYPCDGYIGQPDMHEATPYLRDKGVRIETVFDSPFAPFGLRILHRLQCWFRGLRRSRLERIPGLGFILKVGHVGLMRVMSRLMGIRQAWLLKAAREWNATAVIIDEVSVQPGRSQMVDYALPDLVKTGTKIYTVLTGQNLYHDACPSGIKPVYRPSLSARTFVPAEHDKYIYSILFPQEKTEVAGNLRMNKAWIKKLHSEILAPPYFDKKKFLEKLPHGKTKVVFMLSKINYGIVDPEVLSSTIKAVGHMPGVAVAIKPHTRGMKLDFMESDQAGNTIDAADIPSAVLTEWADILFFTGSGIAFHAMFLNKQVGLLKYCQKLETIFDDGITASLLNSPEEVKALVEKNTEDKPESGTRNQQVEEWLKQNVESRAPARDVAAVYKARIINDLA